MSYVVEVVPQYENENDFAVASEFEFEDIEVAMSFVKSALRYGNNIEITIFKKED